MSDAEHDYSIKLDKTYPAMEAKEELFHWWHVAMLKCEGAATIYKDGYKSTVEKKLTIPGLESLKAWCGAEGATVLNITYLGHMTKKEFLGDEKDLRIEEIVTIDQDTIDKANAASFEPFVGVEDGCPENMSRFAQEQLARAQSDVWPKEVNATVASGTIAKDLEILSELDEQEGLDEQERISEALARAQADEDRETSQGGLAGSAKADGEDGDGEHEYFQTHDPRD